MSTDSCKAEYCSNWFYWWKWDYWTSRCNNWSNTNFICTTTYYDNSLDRSSNIEQQSVFVPRRVLPADPDMQTARYNNTGDNIAVTNVNRLSATHFYESYEGRVYSDPPQFLIDSGRLILVGKSYRMLVVAPFCSVQVQNTSNWEISQD